MKTEHKGLIMDKSTVCCTPINEKDYEGKAFTWKGGKFTKYTIWQFMHIPLNIGQVMTKAWKEIEANKAVPEKPVWLVEDVSLWKSYMYFLVTKDIHGAEMTSINESYVAKVYDGPYSKMGEFVKDFIKFMEKGGDKMKRMLNHYPYCPKCAKKFGHNHIVMFGSK